MTTDEPLPAINGSLILSHFDALNDSGLVRYDKNQKIVEHTDGDLKVRSTAVK
jgi:ATP adenylyltransferase